MLAIDTYVHELFVLGPSQSSTASSPTTIGGWSAVYDAIAAALLVTADPDRRKLVVALTDGEDTASATSHTQWVRIARASDAVLVIVLTPPSSPAGRRTVPRWYLPFPTNFADIPDSRSLVEATRLTGGEILRPSAFGNNRVEAVRRIIQSFRQSYLLRYEPADVEPVGWHEIELSIKGHPGASIRARRGYFGG